MPPFKKKMDVKKKGMMSIKVRMEVTSGGRRGNVWKEQCEGVSKTLKVLRGLTRGMLIITIIIKHEYMFYTFFYMNYIFHNNK